IRARSLEVAAFAPFLTPEFEAATQNGRLDAAPTPSRPVRLIALVGVLALALVGTSAIALANLLHSNGAPTVIAAWRFDELDGAQAMDSSGNRNTGEIRGAQRGGDARSAGSLVFTPGTSVLVPNNRSLSSSALTIELWMKPTNVQAPPSMMILNKYCHEAP